MQERDRRQGRTASSRRAFLTGAVIAVLGLVTLDGRAADAKTTPSFTLTSGNYRVKVCPITGGSRLQCTVEKLTKGSKWVAVPDAVVLVRPSSEKGAFDEETTGSDGKTKHSKYKYPAGTLVYVTVSGLIPTGKGTL